MFRIKAVSGLVAVCVLIGTQTLTAANTITIGDISGAPGEAVTVDVSLHNDEPITALQIDIPLPDGLSMTVSGASASERAVDFDVSAGIQGDVLRVMCYSLGMESIPAGDGVIASLSVAMGETPVSGMVTPTVIAVGNSGATLDCGARSLTLTSLMAFADWNSQTVDFGRVPIRSSYTLDIPVRNSGTASLEISSVEFSASTLELNTALPLSIAPGSSATLQVKYSPVKRGEILETARIGCNSKLTRNVIEVKATPYAVNELYIADVSGISDSEVEIPVSLVNMDAVNGFTFEFDLPEQLEYVEESFILNTDRVTDHRVVAVCSGGHVTANCYSMTNAPFIGSEGELASFRVRLSGRYGTYVSLSKAVLSAYVDGELLDVVSDCYRGYVSISAPQISVSGSHHVGRTPVTETSETSVYVHNYGSAPLTLHRFGYDGEHVWVNTEFPFEIEPWSSSEIFLTVDDLYEGNIEGTLQLYCNDPDQRLVNIAVTGERYAPNELTFLPASCKPEDGQVNVLLNLDNYDTIGGLQFDIDYDGDVFVPQTGDAFDRADGFTVTHRELKKGTMRYFCYSTVGNTVEPGSGTVIKLPMTLTDQVENSRSYPVTLSNVMLSTPDMVDKFSGEPEHRSQILVDSETGVQTIAIEGNSQPIIWAEDRMIRFAGYDANQFVAVYSASGLPVYQGVNPGSLEVSEAGIYIVKTGTTVTKLTVR